MVTRMNLPAIPPRAALGPHLKRGSAGFTLVELVAVMTIVAVLFALGVPSYQYVTNKNRISGEVNGLLGDMQYARSEAIKEGQTVTVCTSNNSTSANPTCSGSTAWHNGWIAFSDPNGNAAVDVGETILRAQRPFAQGDTFVAAPATNAISFNREGFALNLPNGGVTVTLHAAVPVQTTTRCLLITIVGQLTTQTSGVGACL
jgi:type IV fimbrial biogenesis protein FimT